ncbi:MAG: hypothetical protein AAGI66_08650 [Cyanobacteria bacterium P01_H01_bin.74]
MVSIGLALGFFLLSASYVMANGVTAVNTVNDAPTVAGGTYFNTPGNKTTFTNSAGTGLSVGAGTTVIGREVNAALEQTGNGGHLHFEAPNQLVRIDGNIDVSGVMKNGAYIGNGGKVTINSGFLYQNGQIIANGAKGGMVQLSVTGLTMGPNAVISAKGFTQAGGSVDVAATEGITIPQGAIVDTSGAVVGLFNNNLISMTGSVVNLDGIVQADGLGAGVAGGTVVLTATNEIKIGESGKLTANGADGVFDGMTDGTGGNGGNITLEAENGITNNGLIAVNAGMGASQTVAAQGYVTADYDAQGRKIYQDRFTGERFYKDTKTGLFYDAHDVVVDCPPERLILVKRELAQGYDGANGGNAGSIVLVANNNRFDGSGIIEAVGGAGGKGQDAIAVKDFKKHPGVHVAFGGNGGNGGNGGVVKFLADPTQQVLNNVALDSGAGGAGGKATVPNAPCVDLAVDGHIGDPGDPGTLIVCPNPPVDPPVTPPTDPPVSNDPNGDPLLPPFLVNYPGVNDALQSVNPNLVSYNQSLFLARSPVAVAPPMKFTQLVDLAPAPEKPVPPPVQEKRVVRGYW